MKDQLISFETAKLAKEKEFEYNALKDRFSYDLNGQVNVSLNLYTGHDYRQLNHISAPTQSLLQKWLREKHHINCRVASNSLTYHFPMNGILEEDGEKMCGPKEMKVFRTYEEALEAGLQEALKQL